MQNAGANGVSLHSLRHSYATILLSKGVPLAVVFERLGHADQNITLGFYSHALPADTVAAAKVWNRAMADVLGKRSKIPTPGVLANVCRRGKQKRQVIKKKGGEWRGRRGSNPRPPT